jgi:hypothetical protein
MQMEKKQKRDCTTNFKHLNNADDGNGFTSIENKRESRILNTLGYILQCASRLFLILNNQ